MDAFTRAVKTKLTLTVEEEVIRRAKAYARQNGRSLSDIIENYLNILSSGEFQEKRSMSPLLESLRGSFRAPEGFDYKEELSKGLAEKYLRHEDSSD